MRNRPYLLLGALIVGSLTGCATAEADGDGAAHEKDAAREQAQAWLDAAALPSGAIRADASVTTFNSYQGWPCGPVEELEAFWTIPGATVSETANWLIENPTADLITTALGPAPDDETYSTTAVGYIPAPGAQEGIVYTITKTADGVVVRAEIAALTESAVCPTPPGGGIWGEPGLG